MRRVALSGIVAAAQARVVTLAGLDAVLRSMGGAHDLDVAA